MWFAVSMGLIGIIVGYGVATVHVPTGSTIIPTPAAEPQPSAPTPAAQPPEPAAAPVAKVDPAVDHIRGDKNAKVSVIEYSDFECPFCKRHYPTMKQVFETYQSKGVNWVYRHFPLSFHANAEKEAEASECAAALGGEASFWKFHDLIFERTTSNGTGFALDALVPLAKEIGLNGPTFKECLDSGRYAKKVQSEMDSGSAAGVRGTPGTIILKNDSGESKNVSGALPFDTFKSAIDAFIGS